MLRYISLFYLIILSSITVVHAQSVISGKITDDQNIPLEGINVTVGHSGKSVRSDKNGNFEISIQKNGQFHIRFSAVGYKPLSLTPQVREAATYLGVIVMQRNQSQLDEVEVFGERNVKPKGLELITRMPLKPSDQIQSISIISNKVIEAQGALTLTDAMRNVPGVTLFGSYGGVKESMSARGFRGIPVLKNGVRMDSQFQTASGIVDMQGVESLQMIKGSAAITQGVITDIGNAGGVINVVTKTPNFVDASTIGVRVGSWGQVRPTFDYQQVLNESNTLALRVNGSYERGDSYRAKLKSNRVYINPSLAWKASPNTTFIFEGDFFNDNKTPHTDVVNLAADQGTEALYLIPYDKFLGFDSDNNNTKMYSYMARMDHDFSDHLKLRLAYAKSNYQVDNLVTNVAFVNGSTDYNLRTRNMSRSTRDDKNTTFQFDLIGQDLYTGKVKHTAQIGFDYRIADATTNAYTTLLNGEAMGRGAFIDQIDVFSPFTNSLGDLTIKNKAGRDTTANITFKEGNDVLAYYSTFGLLAQDVIEFNRYLKAVLGLRYSEIITKDQVGTTGGTRSAWNPSLGLIVSPLEQLNLFGSYTTSTSLRSAANRLNTGEEIGPSTTNQIETGIKSDWLDNRLRFNFTYFHILTSNLSNTEYVEGTATPTGYFFKAGDLKRDGVEVELNGRVLKNLTVMLGYAYLDARYDNSPSYVQGSAPMNAPNHTANAWVQYTFDRYALDGLSLSAGIYYVGDGRLVNEYSLRPDGHGNMGGVEPFTMPAYTTINAQIGYVQPKWDARVYINNIGNGIGYNSYFRGGFINQTEPRNVALAVNYKF